MLHHAKLNLSGSSYNIASAINPIRKGTSSVTESKGKPTVRISMKPPDSSLHTPARAV
jgi:hypothetical protein